MKWFCRPVSLIAFDLDDFKLLNDIHGHQEGDHVRRRVAAAARERLRGSDLACRVGGEEFAIILSGTDLAGACSLAEQLRHDLSQHVHVRAAGSETKNLPLARSHCHQRARTPRLCGRRVARSCSSSALTLPRSP